MRAEERRQAIRELLQNSKQPVSASALAARFAVSRQIIVGDIALLRAAGAFCVTLAFLAAGGCKSYFDDKASTEGVEREPDDKFDFIRRNDNQHYIDPEAAKPDEVGETPDNPTELVITESSIIVTYVALSVAIIVAIVSEIRNALK